MGFGLIWTTPAQQTTLSTAMTPSSIAMRLMTTCCSP